MPQRAGDSPKLQNYFFRIRFRLARWVEYYSSPVRQRQTYLSACARDSPSTGNVSLLGFYLVPVGHIQGRNKSMLQVARRIGERVMIGTDIVLTVIDIRGRQVRLGISAPREVVIDREEVRVRRLQAKQEVPA